MKVVVVVVGVVEVVGVLEVLGVVTIDKKRGDKRSMVNLKKSGGRKKLCQVNSSQVKVANNIKEKKRK